MSFANEVSYAPREDGGFAASRPRHNQQGPIAVKDRFRLRTVEAPDQVRGGCFGLTHNEIIPRPDDSHSARKDALRERVLARPLRAGLFVRSDTGEGSHIEQGGLNGLPYCRQTLLFSALLCDASDR